MLNANERQQLLSMLARYAEPGCMYVTKEQAEHYAKVADEIIDWIDEVMLSGEHAQERAVLIEKLQQPGGA